jgi:hypothetical protein
VGKTTAILLVLPGAALSVLFTLSQISLRVVLDETSVARRSLFVTRSLLFDRIDSATFKSSERIDIHILRASYRKMSFTSYAFCALIVFPVRRWGGIRPNDRNRLVRPTWPKMAG